MERSKDSAHIYKFSEVKKKEKKSRGYEDLISSKSSENLFITLDLGGSLFIKHV